MYKRLLGFALLMLILALAMSACGPSTPPAPSPQPTSPPPTKAELQLPADESITDATCNENNATIPSPCPDARPLHFIVITHGNPHSKFWAVVENGVNQAAEDMRVEVTYKSPDTFDLDAMANMIDDAVASHPDGIAVSIPNADILKPHIQKAFDAGIPVVSLNSGSIVAEEIGVLGHFGQGEYTAGNAAGERILGEGIHKGLCLIQEAQNTALQVRCQGFADALNAADVDVSTLIVETDDPIEAQQKIDEALANDTTIDAVLALGPSVGEPALAVLQEKNLIGKVKLAAFDLSPTLLEALKNGEVLFLIDQQPYLQGYLPILYLMLYYENLSKPAVKIVLTGPDIITKEDADKVLRYSQESLR